MGAFGFLGAYTLICIAAPLYLWKISELKAKDIVICVLALGLLVIPAVGSVYPVPPAPVNLFPYILPDLSRGRTLPRAGLQGARSEDADAGARRAQQLPLAGGPAPRDVQVSERSVELP